MGVDHSSDPELEKLLGELEILLGPGRGTTVVQEVRRRIRRPPEEEQAGRRSQDEASDSESGGMRAPRGEPERAAPDFRRIFEGLPGLFLVLDPGLHVVAVSEAYLEATLTRREEIVGRHLFDIFPDSPNDPSADSVRNTRASMQRVLQTKKTDVMVVQRHDVRRHESEGGGWVVRYWSPVNSPLLNEDGAVAYIIHRVENVTDYVLLKHQGAEQAKLTDELRERAVRMEADLYERSRQAAEASEQLKRANEELARMNERMRELGAFKDQFFANISHELRTPLTLILGPLRGLLAGSELGAAHRASVAVAERNTRLLLKIVNDLLDLTKLDAGRMDVSYARTDLARLARFVASHFESIAGDNPIRFTAAVPEHLPAEIDAEKVERVLFNLLSNAFKFTPAGGAVRLELRADGEQARIVVDDTGPGVPPELREAVFERFRQIDGTATRGHGGTGLGLAIVREFVALHGGSIALTEAPGGGARFAITLPLRAPEGASIGAAPALLDEEAARTLLAGLHRSPAVEAARPATREDAPCVLVVEDNAEMSAFIAEALASGNRVITAFDGRDGLEKALALQPDVIVTDVMMPRMSGEELIREVRRRKELDDVPILVLTARADEQLRVRLLTAGAQACLTKPFTTEELAVRIAGFVARKRQAEQVLQGERELLTRIIDTIPVMITIFDPAQRTFRFNRELRDVLGWTEADAATGDFMAKVYPDPDERRRAAEFMQSLAPGWRDFEVTAKDGTKVLSTWANVRLANDVMVGIGVDVRARRAAEEALRASQQLLASTMENFPTVIAFKDAEGRFIDVNPPVERALGLPRAEIVGKSDHDFYPAEWADEARRHDVEVMQTREPRQREVVTPAPGGTIYHLDTSFPLIDGRGEVYGIGHISHDITALKRAEAALRQSEERYRGLFNSMDEGYCVIEMRIEPDQPLDYRFLEVNEAFERQSTLVDAKEKWMRELRPNHEERWFEIYRDVALTGNSVRFELSGQALEDRWFTVYAFRIGRPEQRHVAVLFSDISELKRSEQALREAVAEAQRRAAEAEERERVFTAMMEHIPMGITIADAPDVNIRAVSRYGRELLEKSEEQIAHIPASEHPKRWDIYRADAVTRAKPDELPLTRATQKGEIVTQEEWVVGRSNGLRIPILCTAGPIRGRNGEIVGGVIGWQDISDRKRTEEELKRTAQRLAALNRLGRTISSNLDLGKVFDEFADQMRDLVAFDRTAFIALHPDCDEWEVVHQSSRTSDAVPVGRRAPMRGSSIEWLAREKKPLIEDTIGPDWSESAYAAGVGIKSRAMFPLMLNAEVIGVFTVSSQAPAMFTQDTVSFLQGLADHLAVAVQNARLYAQVQEHAAKLEQRIVERTKQLEDANRELEAFSYSVSHDLRAPLRAVAGFSNILVEEHAAELSPQAARYAGIVQDGARRMGQLIDDLLAFSRLGRHALSLRQVDLGQLVREVAAELNADLQGRAVEWRIAGIPPVRADSALLRQVITNLLSNAVKYSRPRDLAVIEVGASRPAENGPVIYHVRDNGVGFDMKYASKLFGVFQRLHRPEEFEGTGVGLAIVQRIIHRHGGRIWAESEPGVGTTFHFTLEGNISDE